MAGYGSGVKSKREIPGNLQLIIDGKDASEIMKEIQDVAAQVREEYAN